MKDFPFWRGAIHNAKTALVLKAVGEDLANYKNQATLLDDTTKLNEAQLETLRLEYALKTCTCLSQKGWCATMRLAKKQDGGLKVAPAVHRKVKGKPKDGEAQGDDIFPKCYYPYTALNKLIFPIAQKAYQDRLAVTKKV